MTPPGGKARPRPAGHSSDTVGPARRSRSARAFRLIALNKPFDVLCQFTQGNTPPANGSEPRRTLADLRLPPGLYPAGRLDRDSEGLLLLTDDGALQHRLSDPSWHLAKRYRVQVDGCPDTSALQLLRDGVMLKDGRAHALEVRTLTDQGPESEPWPRVPPIRVRRHLPTTWLELGIDEGRNRQVRRMTAAIGHPTLRLIRTAIGPFELEGLLPGDWHDIDIARLEGGSARGANGRRGARRSARRDATRRAHRAVRQWPRSTE